MAAEIIEKSLHLPVGNELIPPHWKWYRLDDTCENVFDCPHSTPKKANVGPLMARTQDIMTGVFRVEQAQTVSEATYAERIKRAEPSRGDLMYSREGTYFGIAAEVPPATRVCLGQRMVLIRPNPELVDFRFLRHWLNSPVMAAHIHGYRDGSVAERLNLPTIRALPTLIPPLQEQRAIASILGTLDDKIELNRRMNETLESMARAIFKSWFVDFDPVRAKMDGRQPTGMDADTASLFPDSLEHVDGIAFPAKWKLCPVSEAIEVNPKRRLAKGQMAPYLDMKSMPTGGHHPTEWISREFNSGTRFINGDTLLARITPCLENGKTAFVDFLAEDEIGWGSTEYIVLRSRPPLPLGFSYYLARSDEFRTHAINNMTGSSGRQRVPTDCFHQFLLSVPDQAVSDAFGKTIAPSMERIKANCEESRTLAALRDTLLPKLLSGEIRVGEAEQSFADSLSVASAPS
ncbi:Type I restriction modification DNA specificity domain protein [Stieleria maiorica]|uniref:Type I restriction modification DNA specificity domain protein n=1 Tax=Stieleria maiorica TaxID=2795974 RepID=A0A5B9MDD5_9BACT|nr:restriction endonuclease subunit S [Stieleria maiorica]QEF98793.1 Type I restriction modification DNA specificity domain protein [Stieleria maiorica]